LYLTNNKLSYCTMDCVFRFLLATEVTAAESAMDSTLAILATLIGNYSWLLSLKSAYGT